MSGINSVVYKGDKYFIDVDGNKEYDKDVDIELEADIQDILDKLIAKVDAEGHTLEDVLKSIDETWAGKCIEDQLEYLKQLIAQMKSLEAKLPTAGDKKALYEEILAQLRQEAANIYKSAIGKAGEKYEADLKNIGEQLKALGVKVDTSPNAGNQKSAIPSGGQGTGKYGGGNNNNAGGAKFGMPNPVTSNATYGTFGGFNMDSYLSSLYNDQAILDGWDSIGQNKMEQQKMMMLFFHFARMAMSGDLNAMYRFMQFITYIISKDKAIQNVRLASKLIEYENQSRIALQELLNTPPPDGSDMAAQMQFTQTLESTRAQQSSMATAQKLLAQMMEEMASVVEVCTGATEAMLDAAKWVGKKIVS